MNVVIILLAICVIVNSDIISNRNDDEELFEDELYQLASDLVIENNKTITRRRGCSFNIQSLPYPQPVYIHGDTYLSPSGNSGNIVLESNEEVLMICVGPNRNLVHENIITHINQARIRCSSGSSVSGVGLVRDTVFEGISCSSNPQYSAEETGETCFDGNVIIRVGYIVEGTFHPLFWSCFDKNRLEVLYVWYTQTRENGVFQTGVSRPYWTAGSFFGDLDVNNLYSRLRQAATISGIVGQDLANKYITENQFLSRGHLAARTDFVFATGQRASFYFINAAPQWRTFNAGNWESLEQNLRKIISERGYNTVIYTGTFGVLQLRDQNNRLQDIYLNLDVNNNPQIPAPLYFYKVVYEESTKRGTAFVSINNPYLTLAEAKELQFCPDQCRDNRDFNWITWNPDEVEKGYSFCCYVDDFRMTVNHLPEFEVDELLGNSAYQFVISKLLYLSVLFVLLISL